MKKLLYSIRAGDFQKDFVREASKKLYLTSKGVEQLKQARYRWEQTRYMLQNANPGQDHAKCLVDHKKASEALKQLRIANRAEK
jgi:DNA-binding PadR family transcriptional regulator